MSVRLADEERESPPSEEGDDARGWERNAQFWIEAIRGARDRYRTELTDAAVLRAIGDPTGHVILDAGCGEGYLSRELAGRGATTIGVDRSPAMIAAARAAVPDGSDGDRMTFALGDITRLHELDLPTTDLVVANLSLNDLPDPLPAFTGFAAVLRPGGRLVALMLHPSFYPTPAVGPEVDVCSTTRVVKHFDVGGRRSPAPSTRYLRSLSSELALLRQAGFRDVTLTEPMPTPEQAADPWWRENFRQPLFLLVEAVSRGSTHRACA